MSNKFRIAKESTQIKKPNPYERFQFRQNPFPKSPGIIIGSADYRENGSIYCHQLVEDEEKQFEKLLIPKPSKPETNRIAFLMDFTTRRGRGIGKTAFLNYEKNRIMKDFGGELSESDHVIFASYILPIPGGHYNHFWKISRLIIKQLVDQNIINEAICRLKAFSGLIPQNVLDEVGDDLVETLGQDSWLQEKKVSTGNLNHAIKSILEKLNIDAELTDILAFGGNGNLVLTRYMDNQSDAYWRKNGDRILFSDLIRIFLKAGFTKGIILFDELEKVFPPLNRMERRTFIDNLRHFFIDGDFENTKYSFYSVLFTIHPYLQELMVPHWEAAGMDRFASIGGGNSAHENTIYFRPVAERFAIPLAQAYINASRLENTGTDTLFPFTEPVLQEALKISNSVPGFYLKLLHTLIEKAIEENVTEITMAMVQKTANTINPMEPDIEEKIAPLSKPIVDLREE